MKNSTYSRCSQMLSAVKQVAGHDACDLLAQERRPSTALPPRCRVEPLAAQRGPNRGRRDAHAEPRNSPLMRW
jgi:hypothetical protein